MQITQIMPDRIILSDDVSAKINLIKKMEEKSDPNRRFDLLGPYEAVWLERTGKMPPEYYEEGDVVPWGLLLDEAKRNILWQVLFGCLDIANMKGDWAFLYAQLVMDSSLNVDEFARELAKLNNAFLHALDHRNNVHKHLQVKMGHISCPGCSATSAVLLLDPHFKVKFEGFLKTLSKMTRDVRVEFLQGEGLTNFINTTIQSEKNGIILVPS